MTDPISGKMAQEVIQQNQVNQVKSPGGGEAAQSPTTSFQQVMENQQAQQAEAASQAKPTDAASGTQASERPQQVEKSRLDDFVRGISKDEKQLEKMMKRSMRGSDMSPQELLQMQSLVYRYSQKVELASKVVDKGTGGLKQIMNTQV